jgi:hypothetical protein
MSGKKISVLCLVAVGLLMAGPAMAADPDLVGHWKLDDAAGLVATDSSVNASHGTLNGGLEWVEGVIDGGLLFDGSTGHVEIPANANQALINKGDFCAMVWFQANDIAGTNYMFQQGDGNGNGRSWLYTADGEVRTYVGGGTTASGFIVEVGEWYHEAFVVMETGDSDSIQIFVNGEPAGDPGALGMETCTGSYFIGAHKGLAAGTRWDGILDDLRLYSRALTAEEIQSAMKGTPELAANPAPGNDQTDVVRGVTLNWAAGEFAATHDVYFGMSFADVNDGSAIALVSQGQTETSYDAGILEYGQTYYWRIDEKNPAPDNTIFKGNIWSFTVEPIAIPIENITATASGANPGMEASKTIDGSGLNAQDQHSVLGLDMWLTATAGSWIQYEFDKAYKLHDMLVWNSNQIVETFIGFGVKEAVVETSLDGETWTEVQGVPPFAKATAQLTYEANTTVDLSGIVAKFVKITPQNAHGSIGQSGLSEVRFSYVPTLAREFLPADGSTSAGAEVAVSWRAGREAASHQVHLGTEPANLALAGTTDEASFLAADLDYDQTYYWQVVEVNEAETPATYAGEIRSFITPPFGTVDDFESYSGDEGQEVFMTWYDGFGGDPSLGGSTTGHIDGPFVETGVVHNGGQSMPFFYDNDGGFFDIDGQSSSPNFSEVLREFGAPQDWTASGAQSLSIMFAGASGNTGQLYCKIGNTKLVYDGDAATIGIAAWSAWNIDLSTVGGNLSSVRELAIGVDGGGSGILYIDSIRLYPKQGELITPADPGNGNLVLAWNLDEGSGLVAADSSGDGHDGTVVDATWDAGKSGSALALNTTIGYVETAYPGVTGSASRTSCAWIKTAATAGDIMSWGLNAAGAKWRMWVYAPGVLRVEVNGGFHFGQANLADDEWHHVAVTLDDTGSADVADTLLYVDGLPETTAGSGGEPINTDATGMVRIGMAPYHTTGFIGLIDDARIYDRALSAAEIAGLAGITGPIHKPF